MTLGDRIKKARGEAGLTQLELAVKLGRQPTQISRWELDKSEPTLSDLLELSLALGVGPMSLLNGEEAA